MSEDINNELDAPIVPAPEVVEAPVLEVIYSEKPEDVETPENVELNVTSEYGFQGEPTDPEITITVYNIEETEDQKAAKEAIKGQMIINDRILEYPSIADQLAALYDARQGNDKPIKEIDARIKAVKEKYPKEEESN